MLWRDTAYRLGLEKHRGQSDRVTETGIESAIDQCSDLLERDVPGLHFYTLSKSEATRTILAGVRGGMRSAEF